MSENTPDKPEAAGNSAEVCWCGYVDCDGKHSQYRLARVLQTVLERLDAKEAARQQAERIENADHRG